MNQKPTILLFLALTASSTALGNDCGEIYIPGNIGPFDWKDKANVAHIEAAHFGPNIEGLIGTEWDLAGNLSYILRTVPNHPRALAAVIRFGERFKTNKTQHLQYSIECWFDRAIRFRPKETIPQVMFSQYLAKQGHIDAAMKHLEMATLNAKDNGFSHYNIGLMYMTLKEYPLAAASARRAKELGFRRTNLEDELRRLNRWLELDRAAASPDPSASFSMP